MLRINHRISIADEEIELTAIRAQGAGGQNVNKVATAIHLRFDIKASSLPEAIKQKIYLLKDSRINNDGVIVIKSQVYRSQEKNREEALERLKSLILSALVVRKKRIATKPSRRSQQRRLDSKSKQAKQKQLRKRVL